MRFLTICLHVGRCQLRGKGRHFLWKDALLFRINCKYLQFEPNNPGFFRLFTYLPSSCFLSYLPNSWDWGNSGGELGRNWAGSGGVRLFGPLT